MAKAMYGLKASNPISLEVEAGGLRIKGQLWLHIKILSQKKSNQKMSTIKMY